MDKKVIALKDAWLAAAAQDGNPYSLEEVAEVFETEECIRNLGIIAEQLEAQGWQYHGE